MKIAPYLLLLILISVNAGAQGPIISGKFEKVPFEQFAVNVEKQSSVKFYYRKEWTREVFISAEGTSLDLEEVLRDHLSASDLSFVVLDGFKIIITKGPELVTTLPEYSAPGGIRVGAQDEIQGAVLTETEKLYIEGRKVLPTQTLIVGEAGDILQGLSAIITGLIRDEDTGEPLIGATIFVEELSQGSVTDLNGRYTLVLPGGTYTTRFNCLGMEELNYNLEVRSNGMMDIEMKKKLYPIDEITFQASTYHNVKGIQMGFTQIAMKNIKEIPQVMGEKDVLKVIQMLPGVQTTGEGSAGLHVRGSSADQNMFILNKIPIYNASHLFGFFSAFNPDMIREFSFYKGNLPVKYGGKLASVINITGRQGNNRNFTARGGLSPITAHVAVEGPIQKEKSSFIISARSTYSDWILRRIKDPDIRNSAASFYDFAGSVNFKQNDRNIINASGYYSQDHFSLASTDVYQYSNAGASLNWWHQFSTSLSTDISAVFSQYQFQHDNNSLPLEAYRQNYRINHSELKSDFLWVPAYRHKVTFGGNFIHYHLDRGNIVPIGSESLRRPIDLGPEQGIEGALYLSDQIKVFERLTLNAGLRYSLYDYLGPQEVQLYAPDNPLESEFVTDTLHFGKGETIKFYSGPEFRISLNQLVGRNSSLKMSYNRTRQYLFMLSNTISVSPTDQWKLSDYHIRPPMSDQVSLGYYQDLSMADMNFSAEIYYKKINNIVEYKDGADFISSAFMETQVLQGTQEAYGIELMMKKNAGKMTGWMSMTYARTMAQVNGENSWEQINHGLWYPSNYDIPVSVNGIMNYRINRRLSLSSNLVYHTGKPVTYPVALFQLEGAKYVTYSQRNEHRIPDYFRLDLSINVEGNLKAEKLGHSFWMLSAYNLTGRENAYSVFFKTEEGRINGYKLSIFSRPVVTLSWNFKFGNYASD